MGLSSNDLPYADLYLHRAGEVLAPILSERQYALLDHERHRLAELARGMHDAVAQGEWRQVHSLAAVGARKRQLIADNAHLLALGDAVYAPRIFRCDPGGLALAGINLESGPALDAVRESCMTRLRFALSNDDAMADLYRGRLQHLSDGGAVADPTTRSSDDPTELKRRICEAATNEDFAAAERLSTALIEAATCARSTVNGASPDNANVATSLCAAFPDAAVERAHAMGLTAVTLQPDDALGSYLGAGDILRTAEFAAPSHDFEVGAERAGGGGADPSGALREALDLLLHHPCVTSAGTRYLPNFKDETLLIEAFSEREPDTPTALLRALALPRRRGLSRLAVEHAVRSNTPALCVSLGLDPTDYGVIPIPFDAYLRLAPRFGWGGERLWTHFDGYQAGRGFSLRALVGGDAGYGGAADLCSVGRDYESERIISRFCVVRRRRLMLRAA